MGKEKTEDLSSEDKRAKEITTINIMGKIVGLLTVVWLASKSPYAVMFFVVGMLPAILSSIVDKGEGRFASKTISACNFVGIAPYLFNLSQIAEPIAMGAVAKELMFNVQTWVMVYSFAFIGWAVIWLVPNITQIVFIVKTEIKYNLLKEEQESLIEEWGEEIKLGKTKYELQKVAAEDIELF